MCFYLLFCWNGFILFVSFDRVKFAHKCMCGILKCAWLMSLLDDWCVSVLNSPWGHVWPHPGPPALPPGYWGELAALLCLEPPHSSSHPGETHRDRNTHTCYFFLTLAKQTGINSIRTIHLVKKKNARWVMDSCEAQHLRMAVWVYI